MGRLLFELNRRISKGTYGGVRGAKIFRKLHIYLVPSNRKMLTTIEFYGIHNMYTVVMGHIF